MDVFDKSVLFKYLSELKKTDNLLILIGDNEYAISEGEFKGNNKEFLQDHNVNLKSDIYRLEYAT